MRNRAARVKVAAGWWIDRARHVALQHDTFAFDRGIGDRHSGEQRLGVWVQRVGVQIAARGDLDDASKIHHSNAVADVFHHRQIVRDEQIREIKFLLQIFEQINHLRLNRHVERRHRLIAEDTLTSRLKNTLCIACSGLDEHAAAARHRIADITNHILISGNAERTLLSSIQDSLNMVDQRKTKSSFQN